MASWLIRGRLSHSGVTMKEKLCPYCIEGEGFKAMTAHDDYSVCSNCGHQVAPYRPNFRCSCARCQESAARTLEIPAKW